MATALRILLSLSLALLCVSEEVPPTNLTTGFVRFPDAMRQVTWYTTPSGLVVYDGDFVFGTTEVFNNAVFNVTSSPNPSSRRSYPPPSKRAFSAFPGSSATWPGGIVYYRFFDSIAESEFSAVVKAAMNTWSAAVPCLKFVQLASDNNPAGAPGILTIKAEPGHCPTSWGFENTPRWMLLSRTNPVCKNPPVLLRLFGFVLSLRQEHRRPDRDSFLTVRCENVFNLPPSCTANPAPCCQAGTCQGLGCFFTTEAGFYFNQSPFSPTFDLNSIMLETRNVLAKSPALVTLQNAPAVMATTLSALDILRVKELYGCAPGQTSGCNPGCNPTNNQCHFPTAQTCIFPANVPNARAACACRAGFKATTGTILDGDTTKQWRLPAPEGNFRVWVAEGVPCDTLCAVSTGVFSCQEVKELPGTCLRN